MLVCYLLHMLLFFFLSFNLYEIIFLCFSYTLFSISGRIRFSRIIFILILCFHWQFSVWNAKIPNVLSTLRSDEFQPLNFSKSCLTWSQIEFSAFVFKSQVFILILINYLHFLQTGLSSIILNWLQCSDHGFSGEVNEQSDELDEWDRFARTPSEPGYCVSRLSST